MNIKIFTVILIVFFLSQVVFAEGPQNVSKRGTTAAPFLSIGQGARALSMGSAFVAIADDPSAMYWNPAGIASLPGVNLMVDHTYWLADIQYDFIGATVNVGNFGTLGVNLTISNIEDMKVTTVEQQEGTNEIFGVTDMAVGVSYAMNLTDNFALGFNPKIIYQKIWKMSATGIALDMGVKYRTPFDGVILAMSISNFGSKMQMQGNNLAILYDPDANTTGNNGKIPANVATEQWELPLNFRVGLSYQIPMDVFGTLSLAVDALHPSDNYESVNIGAEYAFDDMLYFRGGWKSLGLVEAEDRFTLGCGVKQFVFGNIKFSVDYAYQDFARLKNAQKISLGVIF
jgi:long-subunit fatty acid transport protein